MLVFLWTLLWQILSWRLWNMELRFSLQLFLISLNLIKFVLVIGMTWCVCVFLFGYYISLLLLLCSAIDSLLSLPLITVINDALMAGIRWLGRMTFVLRWSLILCHSYMQCVCVCINNCPAYCIKLLLSRWSQLFMMQIIWYYQRSAYKFNFCFPFYVL